jgi:CheY-like chemotaxis protein
MEVNVVLIDDTPTNFRAMHGALEPVKMVKFDGQTFTFKFHDFQPEARPDDSIKVDFQATVNKIKHLNPGVAIIDLRLEGDDPDDFSGVALARTIKATFNDCCIILVSSYYGESRRLLDSREVFRFRVDRNQGAQEFAAEFEKQFREAVRTHAAALSVGSRLRTPTASDRRGRKSPPRRVHISYAWGDEWEPKPGREEIVNRIEDSLRRNSYDIWRDKTRLRYKDLIGAFMKKIGRGRCVVVVVSDKYLRSPNGMYELVEIYRNKKQGDCAILGNLR